MSGLRDVTLDMELMNYLVMGALAADMDVLSRCTLAAHFLWLDEVGRLWTQGRGEVWVEIPPINSRLDIVRKAHMSLGYSSRARLCELLRSRFFWNGMSRDCLAVAAASLTAQMERARFCRPRWLYPTEKSNQPFRYYALDCFVQLSPAAPNGGAAVVIAIDLFTKWLEYMILPHLDWYYVT